MIYFIQAGPDGPVKIGWTTNLKRRTNALQTGAHVKLATIRTIDAPEWAEPWLHDQFAQHRAHGEWFTFHPDMLTIQPPDQMPRHLGRHGNLTKTIIFKLRPEDDENVQRVIARVHARSGLTISKAQVVRMAIEHMIELERQAHG